MMLPYFFIPKKERGRVHRSIHRIMANYAVKVESGRAGEDGKPSVGPVFRNSLARNGFPPLDPDMTTSWDVFRVAAEKYPNNRMLGWREIKNGKGSRIGICGANCPQWIVAMEGEEYPSEPLPPQPHNICTIMYTSGTSGDPKEAMALGFSKLRWMRLGYSHKTASPFADMLAFRKVKARLGGRVRLIISGGAPLNPEIEEFLRVTSCAYLTQGYGLTETCGLSTVGFPDDMSLVGTVGVASTFSEVRLEEAPELGYDPLGTPSRGEICVRGKTLFSEYYKNPELTKEVMIWVYGDSFRSMLVAVVTPHEDSAKRWAEQNGHKGSLCDLCKLEVLNKFILQELKTVAETNKLRGFEYIKGIVVDPLPFDIERDLVTPTMKKKRAQMLKFYKSEIDKLYHNILAEGRA
ncbi:AMP-binding enzyme [Musa troglodytarum]|uniref:4-coumarate--CoA ligase n=1 Tax=Musa troglodytarum TaxID=320322 RepID=A0A9E7H8B7_9LILI|nr:AMP-binding enzyme [Musa troglodytarum]